MPNVLTIAYYFPPLGGGGTQRILKFSKYLPEFGWNPIVLTVKNSHYIVMDKTLENEISSNLKIERTMAFLPARFFRKSLNYSENRYFAGKTQKRDKYAWMKRCTATLFSFLKNIVYTLFFTPDEFVGWIPFAVQRGLRLIKHEKINIIFTTAPPNSCHLIGLLLKKLTKKYWVADFRDLWDQYPDNYNPFHFRVKQRFDTYLERIVIKNADRVLVVSDVMRQQMSDRYPDEALGKFRVLMNGYDTLDFEDLAPIKSPGKFVIAHSGTLFEWRRATHFLHAIKNLIDRETHLRESLTVKFIGLVNETDQRTITKLGLEPYVQIIPYLPYKESLRHLVGADLLLVIVGDFPLVRNMVTSKVFDYIGARRPILSLADDCVVNRMIQEDTLGTCVGPNDLEAIEQAILHYFRTSGNGGLKMAEGKGHRKYQRRFLTRKLSEVFVELES